MKEIHVYHITLSQSSVLDLTVTTESTPVVIVVWEMSRETGIKCALHDNSPPKIQNSTNLPIIKSFTLIPIFRSKNDNIPEEDFILFKSIPYTDVYCSMLSINKPMFKHTMRFLLSDILSL